MKEFAKLKSKIGKFKKFSESRALHIAFLLKT